MATLSDCAKSFIRFLTGRYREQLKTLLQTYKQILQIELASLSAKIGRMDIIASSLQNYLNDLDTLLSPIEKQLSQLPFEEFKNCTQVAGLLGDIENIYLKKKSEYTNYIYKTAQFGFASAHINNLRNQIENQLDYVDALINYLDNVAALNLLPGDAAYVYTSETDANGVSYNVTREGTITSVGTTTVTITMTDTGIDETFSSTQVQPK